MLTSGVQYAANESEMAHQKELKFAMTQNVEGGITGESRSPKLTVS